VKIRRALFRPLRSLDRHEGQGAFTLVELLVVLAIMALLTGLMVSAFGSLKNASNVTTSAYTVAATLERGRAYAMAHNTYVWVGFYEENADAGSPTRTSPAYTGVGRVVIGMAASVDGTDIIDTDAPASGGLPPASIVPVQKLVLLQNVDLNNEDFPAVSSSPLQTAEATKPSYTIASNTSDATSYPMTIGAYTFYKTVRFSPTGESIINDGTTLYPINEIDLRPTHGDQLDRNSPNVAAIRFTGIGGNVAVYRN
jgi:prepilin-type N-terminal cleavage/methylation domain-containing protein